MIWLLVIVPGFHGLHLVLQVDFGLALAVEILAHAQFPEMDLGLPLALEFEGPLTFLVGFLRLGLLVRGQVVELFRVTAHLVLVFCGDFPDLIDIDRPAALVGVLVEFSRDWKPAAKPCSACHERPARNATTHVVSVPFAGFVRLTSTP